MPENNDKLATSSVLCLANRFSADVPEKEINKLKEEIIDYILAPSSMLPTAYIEEGKSMQSTELCSYWQGIGSIHVQNINGMTRFP